jgi:hypothetical protein
MADCSPRRRRPRVGVRLRLIRRSVPTRPRPSGAASAAWVLLDAGRPALRRAPGLLLGRSRFAEVADPVVVSVTGSLFDAECLAATACLAPAESPARLRRPSDGEWSARVLGPDAAECGRTVSAVAVRCHPSASLAVRPGIVGIGVGPPQILLVLRPSGGHNDWLLLRLVRRLCPM